MSVIQDKIDHLPAEQAQQTATINLNTQDPLHAWMRTLPDSRDKIIEAFQQIEVEEIDSLTDAMTKVITGTESLKQAFHDVAAQILSDLIKLTIRMLIIKGIEAAMGGGGGGWGGYDASTATDFSGSFGSISNAPAFAAGGSITVGGRSGTDRNVLSMNGLPIARVSYGETINIANDDTPMGPMGAPNVNIPVHIDATGADPAALAGSKSSSRKCRPHCLSKLWRFGPTGASGVSASRRGRSDER